LLQKEDKSLDATYALPRIILAMGAKTVESVSDQKYASQELSEYGYIVIREPSHYSSDFDDCQTVHWSWVKECLIASRYLPLPSWNTEYSQET